MMKKEELEKNICYNLTILKTNISFLNEQGKFDINM